MALRTFVVTRPDARRTLAEFLHRQLGLKWADARQLIRDGHVRVDDQPCHDSTLRLQRGQRLSVQVTTGGKGKEGSKPKKKMMPAAQTKRAPGSRHGIVVRHVDEDIVVVDKPAGLTTMRHTHEADEFGERGKRFLPRTLADLLPNLLPRQKGKPNRVIAVHRLDRDTSGLVVFARTPQAAKHLGQQLRQHSAERRYLALVRGKASDATIESWLVRDRGDGRRGSGSQEEGQRAVTHLRLVEALGEFSLVECRLETGRTHQVRIHLGENGTPLCGEKVYDRPPNGAPHPDRSGARRVALHAASLGLEHPRTGQRLHWASPLPDDLQALLTRLRERSRRPAGPGKEND